MKIRPYLTFNGNCGEAVDLYRRAFGVEAKVMRFGDMPQPPIPLSDEQKGWILQAELDFGTAILRMSDTFQKIAGAPSAFVSIGFEGGAEEVQNAFKTLQSNGGQVKQPLAETFYATLYGEVIDKFGIEWKMAVLKGQA